MKNRVVWFEVAGKDADSLRGFYGGLFDWSFAPMEGMDYGLVPQADGSIPGGVGSLPGRPSWTTFYVEVDDVAATLAQAAERGGAVLMPATRMPDMTLGVFADPEGHPVGLYAAA